MQEAGLPNREEWKGSCDPKCITLLRLLRFTQTKITKRRKLERATENWLSCVARDLQLLNGKLHYTHSRAHTHTHTYTQSYVARDLLHLCFRDMATFLGTSCSPSPSLERTGQGGTGRWGGALDSDIHHTIGGFPRAGPRTHALLTLRTLMHPLGWGRFKGWPPV